MFSNVFPKIVPIWDNVENHDWAGQVTDGNIVRRRQMWLTYQITKPIMQAHS